MESAAATKTPPIAAIHHNLHGLRGEGRNRKSRKTSCGLFRHLLRPFPSALAEPNPKLATVLKASVVKSFEVFPF